jgi:hypothetical protein
MTYVSCSGRVKVFKCFLATSSVLTKISSDREITASPVNSMAMNIPLNHTISTTLQNIQNRVYKTKFGKIIEPNVL